MCGIGGFIKAEKVSNGFTLGVVQALVEGLEDRGRDATGVYTSEGLGVVRKAPVPASEFKDYPDRYGRVTLVHTRQATVGDPRDNHNNHPIVGPKYVMVHNGCCPSLKRVDGYKYLGEVDSEILLSYIETYGIKEGLKKFSGSAAIAFCEKSSPRKVYFWKWHSPLWLAWVNGYGCVFASTREILNNRVLRQRWVKYKGLFTWAYTYEMDEGDLITLDLDTMEFSQKTVKGAAGAGSGVVIWGDNGYDWLAREPWGGDEYYYGKDAYLPGTEGVGAATKQLVDEANKKAAGVGLGAVVAKGGEVIPMDRSRYSSITSLSGKRFVWDEVRKSWVDSLIRKEWKRRRKD